MQRNHLHPAVHRVQDAVTSNSAASWKTPQLAAVACTIRNLNRLFSEHAGRTPLNYVPSLSALLLPGSWSRRAVLT